MTAPTAPPDRDALHAQLVPWGQEHLLCWWDELDVAARQDLAHQIHAIDFGQLQSLFQASAEKESALDFSRVRPVKVLRLPTSFEDWIAQEHAAEVGLAALQAGQVAIVIVAGGQGTRLGFDGPKGTFPIGPVTGASLYQILAEKVVALVRRVEQPVPVLIMTSPDNDAATRSYFGEHRNFGLDAADVTFFCQGTMPVVDRRTGRVLLAEKGRIAASPNGHGGTLQALADGGHLDALQRRGVRQLFYCQVDNPLVKMADPAYLGQHVESAAEISVKIVAKTGPDDPLGNLVEYDGRTRMIEYTELPKDLAGRRDVAGNLEIWAGSIAIHCFQLDFLTRLARGASMLPYHRAMKKVPFVDDTGQLVKPAEPNAIKYEMFIFDALPLAEKALVVETGRSEEFEPLKNAEGQYSPASVRQAMSNLHAEWLNHAGIEVVRRPDGSAAVPIEISPLFATSAEELRARIGDMDKVTGPLYLGPADELRSTEIG
jgi:UDP-N-acetylglucosamine/UDP-N-acetylgalactosamine diphosphorylase